MLKDYEIDKPVLETDRLIIRPLTEADVPDLKERLNGNADVRNIASNKVLERCGFIKEGTIRQGKMVSVYCDYNIYGMLREDYLNK